jgi:hypothetical protein
MEIPTVYFADARARSSKESLISKFDSLIDIELKDKISKGDLVAIKTHMGSPLSTRYLRPFYIRRLVEHLKKWGAKPFVAETTGLGLTNPRGTAQKYLEIAAMHGFTQETVGAPIIIADGQFGTNITKVKFNGGLFKEVTFAKMLTKVDFLISAAHFTGHAFAGPAGAIKNVGVGCAGKTSKGLIHFKNKPKVNPSICDGSPGYSIAPCITACPVDAVSKENNKAVIDKEKCIFCYACVVKCPQKAIETERMDKSVLQKGIAELATAFVTTIGKENIYNFNFLIEIDWNCDCEHLQKGWNDTPIVPDLGILASSDLLAIDQAAIDLINAAPGIPGSMAEEYGVMEPGVDKLGGILKDINPQNLLVEAEKIRLGSRKYKLERLEILLH